MSKIRKFDLVIILKRLLRNSVIIKAFYSIPQFLPCERARTDRTVQFNRDSLAVEQLNSVADSSELI